MAVYVSNLTINTGTDFNRIFTLESSATNSVLNLAGYNISSQMRKHAGSTGVTTFTTSIYSESGGQIQLGLTTSQTASLKPGRYVYDVVITDTENTTTRVVEGMVLVSQGVTR